jgi:hypothetical protein
MKMIVYISVFVNEQGNERSKYLLLLSHVDGQINPCEIEAPHPSSALHIHMVNLLSQNNISIEFQKIYMPTQLNQYHKITVGLRYCSIIEVTFMS